MGRTFARHHWAVIAVWILAVVVGSVAAGAFGGEPDDDFTIPGTDSQAALDILAADFPQLAGTSANVVFQTPPGQTVADYESEIGQTVANLQTIPEVASVSDPFATTTQLLHSQSSPDGTIAYSTVLFSAEAADVPADSFDLIVAASQSSVDAGLNVQLGGQLVDTQNPPTSTISDYADEIGLLVALVVLLALFRSLFVAVLPILNAVIGVALATAVVTLLETSFTIPTVGPILGTMLGLGVGVDYSLFIITRAFGELDAGHDPVEAMGRSLASAGRAVIFAGFTICMASVALLLVPVPMVRQMGVVAALFVAIMVVASLTLLPAFGGLVGERLLTWRTGHPVPMTKPATSGLFAALGRLVTRHPAVLAIGAVAVFALLASPARDLQTGWVSDDADPTDMTQRQAYDLLTEGFGPGVNGELLVVVETGAIAPGDQADVVSAATSLQQAIADTPGVQVVSPPFPDTTPDPTAFALEVQPTTGPDDPATAELVRTIRDQTIPATLGGGQTTLDGAAHVGGLTATIIDLTDVIDDAMPAFIATVLGAAFLLLLLVFRSLLVSVKAVLVNLLSIGAAFGMLVAVFQWGWGSGLIGIDIPVDIVAFVPLLVFAIVFGLSMDYEVFLMSRMQEEHQLTGDPMAAVDRALSTTGRVIISAALVMFSVFVAFVSNPNPIVKQIGLGLALGVLVDATIGRLVLVPSVMALLGRAGWYLPGWLDRLLPNIGIEAGEDGDPGPVDPGPVDPGRDPEPEPALPA